jgi:hypothetical protein
MWAVRTTLIAATLAFGLCSWCGHAAGQEMAQQAAEEAGKVEPLVTDRPDTTESPEVVGRGRFQLEAGYSFLDQAERDSHEFGELLGRLGLSDAVELRIGLNSFAWQLGQGHSTTGLRNASLGAKIKLLHGDGDGLPDLAVIVSTSVPTGTVEGASDSLEPAALLAASWTLSRSVGLAVNAGYANIEGEGRRLDEFKASAAFGFMLTDRWGAFVEYFGIYPGQSDGVTITGVDTGLTWLWTPDLQLDTRVGYEFSGAEDTFFLGVGLSSRW